MAGKDNLLLWVIAIAILLIAILPNIQKQNEFVTIKVYYYKDGVEVQPKSSFFSIVTPPGGTYDAIAFGVTVKNTGTAPINNVVITSFSGGTINLLSYFGSTSFGNLAVGQSIILTSNPISTSQFETLSQPISFNVQVSGTNTYNSVAISQQGTVPLTITPSLPSVNFRTTGLMDFETTTPRYGSSIAYSNVCGNTLQKTAFRYDCDAGCSTSGPCSSFNGCSSRKCGPTTYYDIGTKVIQIPGDDCYLYYYSPFTSDTYLYIGCTNQAGTACLISQYYPTKSGLGTIDTSPSPITPTLEKTC